MSAGITVPPEYRAYEFARYEIEFLFTEAQTLELTDLKTDGVSKEATISIFHRPEYPNILRIGWPEITKYYWLTNYHELRMRYPDMVKTFEQNGQKYYQNRLAEDAQERVSSKYYLQDPAIAASFGHRPNYNLIIVT